MTIWTTATLGGEQVQPVFQSLEDLAETQCASPCSRKFERERDAFESHADVADLWIVELEHAATGCERALNEECASCGSGSGIERADHVNVLAVQSECLPACGKHCQSRAPNQDAAHDFGSRIENVLAVVEHDETLTVRQPFGELIERRLVRIDVDEARGGNRGSEIDATADGCQIDEEHPTGPARLLAAGNLDGQACLAHTAGPGQRHQPRHTQALA